MLFPSIVIYNIISLVIFIVKIYENSLTYKFILSPEMIDKFRTLC